MYNTRWITELGSHWNFVHLFPYHLCCSTSLFDSLILLYSHSQPHKDPYVHLNFRSKKDQLTAAGGETAEKEATRPAVVAVQDVDEGCV